jgi:hypothetical protein
MYNIFQLVYYEGDEERSIWSVDKEELEKTIKDWEEQGLGVGNDEIYQISFTNEEELVEHLNDLQGGN